MPAAEAGLDDGDVDLRLRERGERGRGEHLELRGPERFRRGAHGPDSRVEVHLLPTDPDPLGPAAHVR